jgi:hypothetical protein
MPPKMSKDAIPRPLEFLNLFVFGQMDSEIHLTIICKKSEKNLGMFHFLKLFRVKTKYKHQHLHMKKQ